MGIPVPERTLDGPGVSVLENHGRPCGIRTRPSRLERAMTSPEVERSILDAGKGVEPFPNLGYEPSV